MLRININENKNRKMIKKVNETKAGSSKHEHSLAKFFATLKQGLRFLMFPITCFLSPSETSSEWPLPFIFLPTLYSQQLRYCFVLGMANMLRHWDCLCQ